MFNRLRRFFDMSRKDFLFTSESVTEGHPDKIADQISDSVLDAIMAEEETKGLHTSHSIHIHSIRKRLTDADGISGKACIDGLVHAGILQDDSPAFVSQVSYSQEKGKEEKTIITLTKD